MKTLGNGYGGVIACLWGCKNLTLHHDDAMVMVSFKIIQYAGND